MDLSVIVLNYNTKRITSNCLDSIKKQTKGIYYEVIVVDNASTDGSVDVFRKRDDIKLMQSSSNVGFAKGNNIGIRVAKGDFVLLLNSDTELIENSFLEMVSFLRNNKDIGIAGCKLKGEDGKTQSNGGFFPSLFKIFFWASFLDDFPFMDFIKPYHPSSKFYKKHRDLDWVTGAFFMIRRNVVSKVGFLNEKFFMYVEELEYCYRAKKLGFRIFYYPETEIVHLGKASSSSMNAILGEYKGLTLFYKLHKSYMESILLKILLKFSALLRIFVLGIMFRRKEVIEIYAKSII